MANSKSKNVQFVDTTATIDDNTAIQGIKYVGTSASASVTVVSKVTLKPLWEHSGTNVGEFEDVEIVGNSGITVTCANGGKVYLYLKSK